MIVFNIYIELCASPTSILYILLVLPLTSQFTTDVYLDLEVLIALYLVNQGFYSTQCSLDLSKSSHSGDSMAE